MPVVLVNEAEMWRRIGYLEEAVDLLQTPLWKRILFRLNGWPRLPVDATKQSWRYWHRWWGRRDRDYSNPIGRWLSGRFASGG